MKFSVEISRKEEASKLKMIFSSFEGKHDLYKIVTFVIIFVF